MWPRCLNFSSFCVIQGLVGCFNYMENNADMPHHMYVESKHYDIMYVKLLHVKLLPRPQCKFPHVKKQRVKSNSRDIIISS